MQRATLTLAVLAMASVSCRGHASSGRNANAICYAGTRVQMRAAGEKRVQKLIERRFLERKRSRIVEEFTIALSGRPAIRFSVVLTVKGDRFTYAHPSGSYRGSGRLFGPAWAWTRWSSKTEYRNGTRVTSVSRLQGKRLITQKNVVPGGGKSPAYTVTDDLRRLDPTDCRRRLSSAKSTR